MFSVYHKKSTNQYCNQNYRKSWRICRICAFKKEYESDYLFPLSCRSHITFWLFDLSAILGNVYFVVTVYNQNTTYQYVFFTFFICPATIRILSAIILIQLGKNKTFSLKTQEITPIRNITVNPILVFFLKNINSFSDNGFSGVSRGHLKKIIMVEMSVTQIKPKAQLYKSKNFINAIEKIINRVDNISHRVSVFA